MRESVNNCRKRIMSIYAVARSCRSFFIPAWICLVLLLAQQQGAHAGGFTNISSMRTARQSHTATLLNDGSVLVTGGWSGSGAALPSAELYNPAGTFTPITASMNAARRGHTATRLNDGKVLIVGGFGSPSLSSAEIYDPVTRTFTPTGSMVTGTGRWAHTATLLSNGKVLIAGGRSDTSGSTALNTAELYNPVTGSFTATAIMKDYRANHTATLLSDNRVLIAGGFNNDSSPNATSKAEIFDTAGLSSTATADLLTARGYHAAVLLKDTTVLISGGSPNYSIWNSSSFSLQDAEIFTPASGGSFSPAGTMVYPHSSHTATILTSGRVLIAGSIDRTDFIGNTSAVTEFYIPQAAPGNRFGAALPMTTARANYPAILLANGTVLLAGGATPTISASTAAAEIYNPAYILVAPAGYTFPDQIVSSTSPPRSFTISNTEQVVNNLKVNSINISGTDTDRAMFAWSSTCGTLPATITPLGSCSVSVTFAPTSIGIKSASLDITSDDVEIPVWSVPLSGTGVAPPTSTVTVNLPGTGSGTVTSTAGVTPVLSCVSPATSCAASVDYGTSVTLVATESLGSAFAGWSDACTSVPCTFSMNGDKTAIATFTLLQYLQNKETAVYYGTMKTALDAALAGQNVRALDLEMLDTGYTFNTGIAALFHGGYHALADSIPTGYTTMTGPLKISSGRLTIERLKVK
jgi:hypothetical protein